MELGHPEGAVARSVGRRLAVQVEDHPLDYRNFEGTIPQGQYGGGTVMIWDRGRWRPDGEPAEGYRRGKLRFVLEGEKLRGAWTLIRMTPRQRGSTKPQWLLIKSRDDFAVPSHDGDVLDDQPDSVFTGRTLEEIAAGKSARRKPSRSRMAERRPPLLAHGTIRNSNRPRRKTAPRESKNGLQSSRTSSRRSGRNLDPAQMPGSVVRKMPAHPKVQLATLVDRPPEGRTWLHECKFDGYRMLCRINRESVEFTSRNGRSRTRQLHGLVPEVSKLSATTAILDGEVVVLDRHEISDFQALQNALGEDRHQTALMYFVFDILYLDGFDLTNVPLLARKTLLKQLLHRPNTASPSIRYSEHIFGDAARIAARACSAGLEGIVSKRVAAPYRSGRGTDWVKSKCRQGQEFVIGGYTQPTGSREGFGALLVGYYRSDGKLVYAGKVGTGFTRQTLRSLLTQMRPFGRSRTPFADLGQKTGLRGIHWIEPRLVAQVEFNNWTQDGLLRQAAFLGLRNDKSPQAVTRERAANVSRIRH